MKYLIASDIHGSAYYCQKLMQAFDNEKAERFILLGDLLYHGPRNDLPKDYNPKKVIQLLNEKKDCILAVRGNCEAEVDQMVLEFPTLADYAIMEQDGKLIYLTHGHIHNPKTLPPLKKGDILLNGHTHIPACETLDSGIIYFNPGSVSIPKNNSKHSYMTMDGNLFTWVDLDTSKKYLNYTLA